MAVKDDSPTFPVRKPRMTSSHKIVLSLVAVICITLIVFYSVKGNAQQALPGTGTPRPLVQTTPKPANPITKSQDSAAATPTKREQPPAGIDEIMARVKQLDEVKSGERTAVAAGIADSTPTPPVSNTPASTGETHLSGSAPPAIEPSPFDAAPPLATTVEAPAANATAEVPSLTLGAPAKDAIDKPGNAAKTERAYDADLADLAITEDTLPPLVTVTETPAKPSEKPQPAAANNDTPVKPDATDVGAATKTAEPAEKAVTTTEVKPTEAAKTEPPRHNKVVEIATTETKRTADPASAANTPGTYTIRPGDTFSSIAIAVFGAERYWIDIADANPGVDAKKVRVGQVIKLPVIDKDAPKVGEAKTQAKVDAKTDTKAAAITEAKFHEVKAGENLSSISRRYFNTPDHWRHIYLTNREIIGGDPGKLQAGSKLKITAPAKND